MHIFFVFLSFFFGILTFSTEGRAQDFSPETSPTYQKFFGSNAKNLKKEEKEKSASPAPQMQMPESSKKIETLDKNKPKNAENAENVVNRQILDQFITGTNALKILGNTMPGAYFTSPSPLGANESNFYLRGFSSNSLGATLDGLPLG